MFTGIVTDIGTVQSVTPLDEGVKLRIGTVYDPKGIDIGASIACSGVCLTVTTLPEEGSNERWFEVEAWEEALRLTTIAEWQAERKINLERSLKIGDELGGARVDPRVHRSDAGGLAERADLVLLLPGQAGDLRVGEAEALVPLELVELARRDPPLGGDDALDLREEPRVDLGELVHFIE